MKLDFQSLFFEDLYPNRVPFCFQLSQMMRLAGICHTITQAMSFEAPELQPIGVHRRQY